MMIGKIKNRVLIKLRDHFSTFGSGAQLPHADEKHNHHGNWAGEGTGESNSHH